MPYLIDWLYFVSILITGCAPSYISYKILQNDHASYILPQSHTELPENAIFHTVSYLFSWINFFVNTSLDYEVRSCYLIDISNSRYIIMISSFVHLSKNAWIIFLLPLKALLYGTRQPFWVQNSALLVTGHLTNTFPLVMLDYRWWNLWSTCWKTYCQQK